MERGYQIADEYKKRNIPVIMGGAHVSSLPDEALSHCNSIVIGEAESVWLKVLDDFKLRKLKPKYIGERILNLDSLPLPRFDIFKNQYYFTHLIQTTRGCPFQCDFCSVQTYFGNSYRSKGIERVVEEVSLALQAQKKSIFFTDDNFAHDIKRTKTLLKKLITLQIPDFMIQARLEIYKDDDLLDLLVESGCVVVMIGFESLNQKVLNNMKKQYQADTFFKAIEKIQSKGLAVNGFFIVGNDGEDSTIFETLASFVRQSNLACAIFNILTPLPGTLLYHRLSDSGRLLHRQWSLYDGDNICFKPLNMSVAELEMGYRWLYKEVFSPNNIFNRVGYLFYKWNQNQVGFRTRNFVLFENIGYHFLDYPKNQYDFPEMIK